jgi:hypothetical protein
MVSLDDIKSDFLHWPDDVIDQWLLKLANQPGMGWPPSSDPMDGHRWELLLTHPMPSLQHALMEAAKKRAAKLEAKGTRRRCPSS